MHNLILIHFNYLMLTIKSKLTRTKILNLKTGVESLLKVRKQEISYLPALVIYYYVLSL